MTGKQELHDRIAAAKTHTSIIDVLHSLGIHSINKPGDRCTSPFPGEHHTDNAFVLIEWDYWYDFSAQKGGDVLELIRWLKFNGDRSMAIRELCGPFTGDESTYREYQRELRNLHSKIEHWHSQLRPEDLDYLHSRRIKDSTIKRYKIGYSAKRQRLIVCYIYNGEIVYWAGRDRSPDGYLDSNGKKPSKYFKMPLKGKIGEIGFRNIPFGLDTLGIKNSKILHTKLGDFRKDEILCISEGMFDILSLIQEKFPGISPIGGYFKKDLEPWVLSICKQFKVVFLCFDSDSRGQSFTKHTAEMLLAHRIPFLCGNLGDIKDVSDYYAAGGNLDELVEQADVGAEVYAASIDDPRKFKEFIKESAKYMDRSDLALIASKAENLDKTFVGQCLKDSLKGLNEKEILDIVIIAHNLIYVPNDGFYEYTGHVWKKKDDLVIGHYCYEIAGRTATNSKICSAVSMMKRARVREIEFNKKNLIVFNNGTLNLDTLQLQEHSPDDEATIILNYDYDPYAQALQWQTFVESVMSKNKTKMRLLQEMCGYVLFSDCRFQKGFMLLGDGSNGKSVFLSVLRKVFGKENCRSICVIPEASSFDSE